MAGFAMCPACRAEYDDPADRRFHAQPNACPDCGPSVTLTWPGGGAFVDPDALDALQAAARALRDGAIVAVKGIGGFHVACLASDEARGGRAARAQAPRGQALRADGAEPRGGARAGLHDAPARGAALGRVRPIVLAPRRPDAAIAPSVAPGAPELGVMLPYSPLHHLLVSDLGETLVLTSGNVSDEPIAYEDDDARERLAQIADLFLVHDRPIETRTDDSVVRVADGRPLVLRRSRGHVPDSLPLPLDCGAHLLACGAELKNTFAVAKEGRAWVGHHVGDLKNYETLRSFTTGIDHFRRLFAVEPEVVAHDLHPEYLSTKHAQELEGVRLIGVQHHHAHLAACLAEHGESGPAIGAIFDGTGYGDDGTVWGGELLLGGLDRFERVGLLFPVRMPGGDAAVRQPWRMACAWLSGGAGRATGAAAPPARAGEAGCLAPGRLARRARRVRAAHHQRRPALRRRGGALRSAGRGELRGSGRRGAGGVADPAETGAYPLPLARGGRAARARRACHGPCDREGSRAGRARAGCVGALPQRAGRRDGGRVPEAAAREGIDTSCCRAACSRTARCSRGRARCSTRTVCACWCRSCFRRTTAASPMGSSPWRPPASAPNGGTAVFGLDDRLAGLAQGEGLALVLLVALLLGLRHASDPDHLAAVSTLIASDPEDGTRRAGRLGLAWGAGHALTLALFGLPVVVLQAYLPDPAQRAAEAAVGVMVMLLAIRLLLRWRRGHFHVHAHRHGQLEHRHLHPHQAEAHDHAHEPEARLGRSRAQAFGIGLVHGAGGSAGVSVLLVATIPEPGRGDRGADGAGRRHGRLDGAAVVRLRLRDHARSGAEADARLCAGDGSRRARLRRLVHARRRGAVPYLL